jgi:hypothetical protein
MVAVRYELTQPNSVLLGHADKLNAESCAIDPANRRERDLEGNALIRQKKTQSYIVSYNYLFGAFQQTAWDRQIPQPSFSNE